MIILIYENRKSKGNASSMKNHLNFPDNKMRHFKTKKIHKRIARFYRNCNKCFSNDYKLMKYTRTYPDLDIHFQRLLHFLHQLTMFLNSISKCAVSVFMHLLFIRVERTETMRANDFSNNM